MVMSFVGNECQRNAQGHAQKLYRFISSLKNSFTFLGVPLAGARVGAFRTTRTLRYSAALRTALAGMLHAPHAFNPKF
ncbi:MAG: hypothetical protein RML94_14775, partial [Bacteroidia bacterium]|nr:hypothetical protein [Bacteroidia bacterium]